MDDAVAIGADPTDAGCVGGGGEDRMIGDARHADIGGHAAAMERSAAAGVRAIAGGHQGAVFRAHGDIGKDATQSLRKTTRADACRL
jgi:hypothetical protein